MNCRKHPHSPPFCMLCLAEMLEAAERKRRARRRRAKKKKAK